jgi:hypothetical protein
LPTAAADDWKPAPGNLLTAWAAKVDPKCPLPEYPRPQMVRPQWTNLNGLWDYAVTDRDAAKPAKFDGKILVPFCIESALSGVKKPLTDKQWLWYRRSFTTPDLAGGKRLLLHFGAVDWESVVTVNGKEIGTHRGGYDAFDYDITDAVKAGSSNELVVRVWDSTGRNGEPHGKQNFNSIAKPGGGGGKAGKRNDPDGVPASEEKARQFERELQALVETHRNHPSIILWVVFNEGWGQYDTARLTQWVKQLDPSRLVDNASGWTNRKVGDVLDMHAYPGPHSPAPDQTRAAVLGEFGGLGLGLDGHRWVDENWGYRGVADPQDLTRKYLELWKNVQRLRDEKGLSAAVYTQITDVETECNGLLTYDRAVFKVDAQQSFSALAHGKFPPETSSKTK